MPAQLEAEAAARLAALSCALLTVVTVVIVVLHGHKHALCNMLGDADGSRLRQGGR